jgi:hypothetical protein
MTKPSTFPLFIDRLRASPAWQYTHHLFGMFMRLLIEMARSERSGYIPNDIAVLRRAARGHAVQFEKQDWPVLMLRFQKTPDGLWWYSDTLLEALELVRPKGVEHVSPVDAKPIERVFKKSFELPEALQTYFDEGYKAYPRHVGKTAAKKAFWRACRENMNGSGPVGAAMQIVAAVKIFTKTPAGNRGSYTPHMSTWLNQGRFLDDPKDWELTDNPAMAQPGYDATLNDLCSGGCGKPKVNDHYCGAEECETRHKAWVKAYWARERAKQKGASA